MSLIFKSTLLLVISAVFASCQQSAITKEDHNEYIEEVLKKASDLRDKKPSLAFIYLDSVYNHISPGVRDLFLKYDFKRYTYMYQLRDYNAAGIYVDSIMQLITGQNRKKYRKEYALANFYKGDLLFQRKKYNETYHYFYIGKKIAEDILDPYTLTQYNYRLGMVCYRQGKFETAISYFKQAFDEALQCKRDLLVFLHCQELLDNIGLCFSKLNRSDSALHYYKKTEQFIRQFGQPYPKRFIEITTGVLYGNMADVYLKQGNLAAGERLLKESVSLNIKKDHDNRDAQLTQLKLSNLYLQTGRLQEGKQILQQVKTNLDTSYDENIALKWRYQQWNYYEQLHQTEQAHTYLLSYISLKDSVENSNKEFVQTDFNNEFEKLSQQYELDLLKQQNEVKTLYLLLSFTFSLMALVIIFLIFLNWKKTRNNISNLTDLNSQLKDTLNALEESNNDKNQIMRIVAHDLKNSVAAVAVITDILLNNPGTEQGEQEMLEMIKISASSSLTMIKDLSEIILAQPAEEMKLEPTDLALLLQQCVYTLQLKAQEKEQTITLKTIDEPVELMLNKERIWQAISNLIVNAIKFSPRASEIQVRLTQSGHTVQIAVEDTGIGIPEEIKNLVFEKFSQAKRPGTGGELAFGLGLSIAKQIIEAHKGTIWFENKPTGGTIFYIELPL